MRPRRDPVPRAKEAWWWLGGLLTLGIAGAGVVAAGIALWENIDIRQLAPSLQEPPTPLGASALPAAPASSSAGFRVVLFESERSSGYFEDTSFYTAEVARWRALASAAGGTVRSVFDAEGLRNVALGEVLLVPEAPCVSSEELAAILRHRTRGGGVVANWAFGVRNGRCEWRGWQPLLDLTGAEAIRELADRDALFLTVPAGLPTSPGLDPGTRIELRADPAIALRMEGARVYWSDWALNPAPDDEGVGADVAISTATGRAGGRVAWFGVRTNQAATVADSVRLERVIANGIRWVGGAPKAAPSPWPGAAQAALTFVVDVEGLDATINARDIAAMFELERVPVSFYVVSQLVQDDEELAGALRRTGEVGTQTVDHAPLVGLTPQDQSIRLRRSWSDIERWTGVAPVGLRAPEETVDSVTLDAWRSVGGRYVVATNEARSASPEVHETAEGPVVLLPRLLKDDYTVIVRDVTLRSQRLADAYLAGTRKMRAIGGLALVVGHTQIVVPGPRLEALRTVADSVRAEGGWWIAEARDVAEWWLARSRVTLEWSASGRPAVPGMASVLPEDLIVGLGPEVPISEATTPISGGIDDLWVDVVVPTLPEGSLPLVDGESVDFIEEDWGMRVRIGAVAAGQRRTVSFVILTDGPATDSPDDG